MPNCWDMTLARELKLVNDNISASTEPFTHHSALKAFCLESFLCDSCMAHSLPLFRLYSNVTVSKRPSLTTLVKHRNPLHILLPPYLISCMSLITASHSASANLCELRREQGGLPVLFMLFLQHLGECQAHSNYFVNIG